MLDISNWRMVKSKALSKFVPAWKGFMTRRPALTCVKMNWCLFLEPNSFLSDEQLENVVGFVSQTLTESLDAVRILELTQIDFSNMLGCCRNYCDWRRGICP
ncbi:hypothetical protein BASA81_001279 [Batrachochytrium salamandrivorans]|nr:hypothetical protein BASA81_001279 [Batrachochytrium salamandrivorans]